MCIRDRVCAGEWYVTNSWWLTLVCSFLSCLRHSQIPSGPTPSHRGTSFLSWKLLTGGNYGRGMNNRLHKLWDDITHMHSQSHNLVPRPLPAYQKVGGTGIQTHVTQMILQWCNARCRNGHMATWNGYLTSTSLWPGTLSEIRWPFNCQLLIKVPPPSLYSLSM